MSEQKETQKSVYSYHTFIFPFLWNDGGKIKRNQFEKCLNSDIWKFDLFGSYRSDDSKVQREDYSAYQYFNNAARSVIYTSNDGENEFVRCFRCMPDLFKNENNAVEYCITKHVTKSENDKPVEYNYEYKLRINGVRLKLYNTGIGMLIYELENRDYASIDDVNRINEWGRRIFRPFYSIDNKGEIGCSLCADCLKISGIGDKNGQSLCSEIAKAPIPKSLDDIVLARIISFFFECDNYKITMNKREKSESVFYIEPIIDDRMFVACFIHDGNFAYSLAEKDVSGTYRYLSDAEDKAISGKNNLSSKLYETVFVDGDGCTCQNGQMLKEMLSKHVYTRWIECGTIHGISEYSFVCISGTVYFGVLDTFLTEYIEIVMLVLAQRASLLAFERRISETSLKTSEKPLKTKGVKKLQEDYNRVKKLQEDYINFDSQYMLHEVTEQQQGIEIYNLILQRMYIFDQKSDIENQIRNLFELSNYKHDSVMNGILFGLAVFGIIETIDVVVGWILAVVG